MTALAMIPGLPKIPFLLIAGGRGLAGAAGQQRVREAGRRRRSCRCGGSCAGRCAAAGRSRRSAEAGRSGPGSWLRAGAAGRCQAGRPVVAAGQGVAPAPGVAIGLHRSPGPHHRQPEIEAARVCGFPAGVEIARWETRDDCLLAISSESDPLSCRVSQPMNRHLGCRRAGSCLVCASKPWR